MGDAVTLIDAIEEVLQTPLTAEHAAEVDAKQARRLGVRLREFYRHYKIPPKSDSELRPYLSPRFAGTRALGVDYYASDKFFDQFDYRFDPSATKPMGAQIKSYLLYCHSVCIHDGLPGLLDYFVLDENSEFSSRRLPALQHLLAQYALVAPLVRRNILIPLSDEVFGSYFQNQFFLTADEQQEISKATEGTVRVNPEERSALLNVMGSLVKEQLWLKERSERSFDLYFPQRDYPKVLVGLLRAISQKFPSDAILEPFNAGVMGSLEGIDTGNISMANVIEIRDAEAFDEFRLFLQRSMQRMMTKEGYYSDFETEFLNTVRAEIKEHKATVQKLAGTSSILKLAFEQSDRILIGAVAGALAGLAGGTSELATILAAAGGAAPAAYEILRARLSKSSQAQLSVRQHFLAFDPQSLS